eukprot:Gb_27179 [translate_table: standard]
MQCCRVSVVQFHHKLPDKADGNGSRIGKQETRVKVGCSKVVKMGLAAALALQLGCGFGSGVAFGFEKDPIEPFTVYGSIFKKYFLEQLVDGKVVARKKGFTANACVNVLEASRETPELQGLPIDLKVNIIGEPSCLKGEGQTREDSCVLPCRKACATAISRHSAVVKKETGYILDESDRSKVVDSCSTRCVNECFKPGKSISFVYPYRPRW